MSGDIPRNPDWCSYCRHPECYGTEAPCEFHKGPDGRRAPYTGRDVYKPTEFVLEVVGSEYFSWMSDTKKSIWKCVGYDRRTGFWMRDTTTGHEKDISERAIGRTFHKVRK